MESVARIAVIGGSGLYRLFDEGVSEARTIATPYGDAEVTIGELAGRPVAFLTRHGVGHSRAPHLINYRANIWALASLGVRAIVSSAAVGSIAADLAPGALVLPDQLIDRTHGRADTFYDQGSVQHLAAADPFCPSLLSTARDAMTGTEASVTPTATLVVIQGPRFSTRAESRWFASAGGHLVNMTLYPEVTLAAELNIGTVNLSYVTDTDADGFEGEQLSAELVFSRLKAAQPRIIAAITAIVAAIPDDYAARELIDPDEVVAVLRRQVAR